MGDDVFHIHAEVMKYNITGGREAVGINADDAALRAHVAVPEVGLAGFDGQSGADACGFAGGACGGLDADGSLLRCGLH